MQRTLRLPCLATVSAAAAGGDPCGEIGANLQSGQSLRMSSLHGVIVFMSAHGSVSIMLLIPVVLSLYEIQVATQIGQLILSGKQMEIWPPRAKKKRTWKLK